MVSIILPTYNESQNLEQLIKAIFDLGISDLKVIIVDDNSPDGTGRMADKLSRQYPVQVIHRESKQGLGSAYIAGFKLALQQNADLIFEMDADFSHDPKNLPRFIEAINQGTDVVIGSRRVENGKIIGWNSWRHFTSWSAMSFSRLVLGLKTKDVTSGYRCYQRKVLEQLNLDSITSNGYAFQEEMIYKCEKQGLKIKEIPVVFKDRVHGQSKLSRKEILEFFVVMWRLRKEFKN